MDSLEQAAAGAAMKYVSTRGAAPALPFDDVVLAGLARDGGLYVPDQWPHFTPEMQSAMRGLDYAELAGRVMAPFTVPAMDAEELISIARDAYHDFGHPDVAPLKSIGDDVSLLELFHGPTLAFKDYALQILARLFDVILQRRRQRITVVGATSGDTGSAAIEACRDRKAVEIVILHPHGRVSEVQRRQMTTVEAANVHNVAIEGTFDDCQALVKAMFNDEAFRDRWRLAAINSINWARIVAQIVYYVHAALALGAPSRSVSFAVPTGNFGNVFAGYVAARMGLPVSRLIIGSNRNDILTRFFNSGRMQIAAVAPTLSPSMDIQVSSNFERLLFELYQRDSAAVRTLMAGFARDGAFLVEDACLAHAAELFSAARFDDDETRATMRRVFETTGELVDPHTAIGIAAAWRLRSGTGEPIVALATAHPAKFPEAVQSATGKRPELPASMADLLQRPEHFVVLPARFDSVKQFVADTVAAREAAA